ncbi:MAG: BlaI/MecI/CopY family transcriptional regulator [Gemmatimonadales bacterium]
MSKPSLTDDLSRRERQVMDALHRRGEATVAEILRDIPDPPSYSAVRSILRILAEKQLVTFHEDGPRYVYRPATPTTQARADVLKQVVHTYFAGSAEQAFTALLQMADATLTPDELARIRERIRDAEAKGR